MATHWLDVLYACSLLCTHRTRVVSSLLTGTRIERNAATSTTDQEALAAILSATNWSERELYQALSDAGVTTSNEATALAQLQSMIEQQQQAGEYTFGQKLCH